MIYNFFLQAKYLFKKKEKQKIGYLNLT